VTISVCNNGGPVYVHQQLAEMTGSKDGYFLKQMGGYMQQFKEVTRLTVNSLAGIGETLQLPAWVFRPR
jgi:hypothetical protein